MVLKVSYYCESLTHLKQADDALQRAIGRPPSGSWLDENDLRVLEFRFATKKALTNAVERVPKWAEKET
jgi:hypothetical protein